VCVACGSTEKVHKDPRAGMVALCADCLGRQTANLLATFAS